MEFKPPCQFVVGDNAAASWRQYKQQIKVYILAANLPKCDFITYLKSIAEHCEFGDLKNDFMQTEYVLVYVMTH